jgi:beta-glucosidase
MMNLARDAAPGRNWEVAYSSYASPRTLHETALWPFDESVHAGVGSVMCAYNRVDQIGSCENAELLSGVLEGELGFQGFAVSD